jgi:hypothetical protein
MSFSPSTLWPLFLRSVATTTTVALVHSAIPATRYATAWLPLAHLVALYLFLGPLQAILHRPGGTFSVPSWLSGAVASFSSSSSSTSAVSSAGEDKGWRDAVVVGGFVAVMNYAAVRVFVGLDPSSSIALLVSVLPYSLSVSREGGVAGG